MEIKMLLGGLVLVAVSFGATGAEVNVASARDAMKVLSGGEVSFKSDVQPIIHDHCLNCHLPGGSGYKKSGLDLSSYENLMKGTKFGPVVIPGDSKASTFTRLLTGTNKGLKMPAGLNEAGTLDRQYILIMRKWVEQGAKNN